MLHLTPTRFYSVLLAASLIHRIQASTKPPRALDPGKRQTMTLPSTATSPAQSTSTPVNLGVTLLQTVPAPPQLNCTNPGGGCDVFSQSLQECTDDACACQLTLAAQVCAECSASQESIDAYNNFLDSCVLKGLASPSSTVFVVTATSAGGKSTITIGGLSPTAEATSSAVVLLGGGVLSEDILTPSSPSPNVVVPAVSLIATTSSTSLVAEPSSTSISIFTPAPMLEMTSSTSPSTLSPTISLNTTLPTPLGALIASSTAMTSATSTSLSLSFPTTSIGPSPSLASGGSNVMLALSQAISFFQSPITPSCAPNCQTWQNLTQSCANDTCICTPVALAGAMACSGCIGGATHTTNITNQVSSYTEYTSACQMDNGNLTPTGTATSISSAPLATISSDPLETTPSSPLPTALPTVIPTVLPGTNITINITLTPTSTVSVSSTSTIVVTATASNMDDTAQLVATVISNEGSRVYGLSGLWRWIGVGVGIWLCV